MKDYAVLLIIGALGLAGCSDDSGATDAGLGVAGTFGATAGVVAMPAAGVPAAGTLGQPPAAGTLGQPVAGIAAGAGGPTPIAGSPGGFAGSAAGGGAAGTGVAGTFGAAGSGTAGGAAGGGAAGTGSGSAGAFQAIYDMTMMSTMCASCHTPGSVFGSPDLSTAENAYASLVDKDASMMVPGQCGGMGKLVTPGNCETSLLYLKLTQAMPKCGRRMPLGPDNAPQTVPQAAIDALCAWIKAGAMK